MRTSESAAQMPGRCSTTSRKQLKKSHASSDSVIANGPYSVVRRTRKRRQMHGNDQAGQRKQPDAARCRDEAFAIPGPATADISAQRFLMKPASISRRLNRRASAPSLQA